MLRWSLQLHKWIGLIVGLQVLGWVLGGLIMTAIPIERVRSEQHIAAFQPEALALGRVISLQAAAEAAGMHPAEATLKTTLRGPVWTLKDGAGKTQTLDATTGRPMAAMTPNEARLLAGIAYQGQGRPVAMRYFQTPPQEAGKPGPLWRVEFNDRERTAFYLSPTTGEVVSRRSNVWRFYDFFWRIHILDFKTGDNFNHPLIVGAAAVTLLMTVTGLVLLWIRLSRDLAGALGRRAPTRRASEG
jgi:uncharacterized iron-regulated membrane protein